MKTHLYILFIFPLLLACNSKTKEIKEKTSVDTTNYIPDHDHHRLDSAMDAYNTFKTTLQKLYTLADHDKTKSLKRIDSLLNECNENYKQTGHTINEKMISDLHFLKGEIYYGNSSYKLALTEFAFDTISDYNVARAACLLKLKKPEEAFSNLIMRIGGACYYDLTLANYFETINQIDASRALYASFIRDKWNRVYKMYNYAKLRLIEIEKPNPKLLRDLHIPSRQPNVDNCENVK